MRYEGRERWKRQCDQPRTSALAPVMHSPVRSHRRLLWTSLNGHRWLSSAVPDARSPVVRGESDRIRSTKAGQDASVAVRGGDACDCKKWSSLSVWTSLHHRRLQILPLHLHQAGALDGPRD
ncbi:hypothetical protein MTO96_021244 [Rhipicephalus appendiculatus]